MERKLTELISAITVKSVTGPSEAVITSLVCDSRKASQGCMFVAVRGVAVDAHKFIPQVTAQGLAAAVVCEELPPDPDPAVSYILTDDSSKALAKLASQWYGRPSEKLKLVGVTGTNGKTTTATLLYEMARALGHKAGLISTVKIIIGTQETPAEVTTPDHITLNALLAQMVEAGCEYAFMEVSSHACHQHRIDGLRFAGGIFSNLTRDHLDYHKTAENYLRAKKMFFDQLPADAFALVNADDKNGPVMLQNTAAKRYTYSLRAMADFRGKIIESHLNGTLLSLDGHEVEVLFTGRFNAYNLLSVYGASLLLGFPPEQVLLSMSALTPVAGRFQTFLSPRGYTAIVDYAHSPDALVNVLSAIREVAAGCGKIITVVGAGGNRDKGKRPLMAREAARLSDKIILTSDNPRFEDPEEILNDMAAGLDTEASLRAIRITDRREAIKAATQMAAKGDVVLVAGKGHENYQDVRGVKRHFDDSEVISQIFSAEKAISQNQN